MKIMVLILVIVCGIGCNNRANQDEYAALKNVEDILSAYADLLSTSITRGEAFPDLKDRREELFNRIVIKSPIGKEIRENLDESLRISASICELIAMNVNTTQDILLRLQEANVEIPVQIEAALVYSSGEAPYLISIGIKNNQLIELEKQRNVLFSKMKKQIE